MIIKCVNYEGKEITGEWNGRTYSPTLKSSLKLKRIFVDDIEEHITVSEYQRITKNLNLPELVEWAGGFFSQLVKQYKYVEQESNTVNDPFTSEEHFIKFLNSLSSDTSETKWLIYFQTLSKKFEKMKEGACFDDCSGDCFKCD